MYACSIQSYMVVDLARVWSLGVAIVRAQRAQDRAVAALAHIEAQAVAVALGIEV